MGGDPRRHDAPAPPITGADLYNGSGRPHGSDIMQGGLGDCYLISTLEQYAERQPDVIKDAIRYDAKERSFGVTLHDAAGRSRVIRVTQGDLQADRTFGPDHGGGADSPAYWSGTHAQGSRPPAWPSVMEVAYAKLNAASARDGTRADLSRIGRGGWPQDAIHALTGRSETREVLASQLRDPAKTYDLIESSIREDRPILLTTNPMKEMPRDGLVKGDFRGAGNPFNSGHAYTVEAVSKDKDGNVSLTLRNPWGHNFAKEQGVNSPDPIVHVSLKTILDNGHLEGVTIGPALVQKQTASEAGHRAKVKGQDAAPWMAAKNAASRSASDQAAANDPCRNRWSDLAARGRELAEKAQGAARTDVASLGQGRGRTL